MYIYIYIYIFIHPFNLVNLINKIVKPPQFIDLHVQEIT